MLLVGCMCFGLVIGWCGGFAGAGPRALTARAAIVAAVGLAGLLALGPAALVAGLAGCVAGAGGHEAFAWGIRPNPTRIRRRA